MSSTSHPPPPASGPNWALIGGILIIGAVAVVAGLATCNSEEKANESEFDAGRPMAETVRNQPSFELDIEEEEDAGEDSGPGEAEIPKKPKSAVAGGWDCSGSIATSKLKAEIGKRQKEVRACYERALRDDNMLAGQLVMKLKIEKSGKVSKVALSGMRNSDLLRCVRSKATHWTFPKPEGGCSVFQAPFALRPKN